MRAASRAEREAAAELESDDPKALPPSGDVEREELPAERGDEVMKAALVAHALDTTLGCAALSLLRSGGSTGTGAASSSSRTLLLPRLALLPRLGAALGAAWLSAEKPSGAASEGGVEASEEASEEAGEVGGENEAEAVPKWAPVALSPALGGRAGTSSLNGAAAAPTGVAVKGSYAGAGGSVAVAGAWLARGTGG